VKRPTQADVARLAKVSRATVSYVLNKRSGRLPISPETVQRVREAARELKYEPDAMARALRLGNTKMIGVLVPDLRNPHFWQIVYGIEARAHRAGYDLLVLHSALSQKGENVCIRSLAHRKVDGLILMLSFTPLTKERVEELISASSAIVDMSEFGSPFDTVISNYEAGTRELMRHLIGLGHRRIGFIYGVANKSIGNDRLLPYHAVLEESGLPPDRGLVAYCGTSIDDGYEAARNLLAQPDRPTALIVINDLLAIGAMRAAADMGIRIPEDLSVAGFDDIPLAGHLSPRLTTVHRDAERCGELAVELLLNRLKNPTLAQQVREVGSSLIIRGSTGPARERTPAAAPQNAYPR
jgi:LacI family transcriptional regulator